MENTLSLTGRGWRSVKFQVIESPLLYTLQETLTWLTIWWLFFVSICSNIIDKHKCKKSQCHQNWKYFENCDFGYTIRYRIVKWKTSWPNCSLPDTINFTIAKTLILTIGISVFLLISSFCLFLMKNNLAEYLEFADLSFWSYLTFHNAHNTDRQLFKKLCLWIWF